MENLVTTQGGKVTTDSLRIAAKFGKQHRHVLRDIRELLRSAQNWTDLGMFSESTYLDEYGRSTPLYTVTRDGFSLLVMGFTGKQALDFKLEFIAAFNKMEEELQRLESEKVKNLTPAQMLLLQAQQLVEHEKQIQDLKEKQEKTAVQVLELASHIHTRPDYYTIAGFGRLNGISINDANAKRLGKIASGICKGLDIEIGSVPDTKWGSVNSYPSEILDQVFKENGFVNRRYLSIASR